MSALRTITAVVADENKKDIRESSDGRKFVVVDCDAALEDGVLYEAERKAYFADDKILTQIKPGMKIMLK